jgi:hypothetical protein
MDEANKDDSNGAVTTNISFESGINFELVIK